MIMNSGTVGKEQNYFITRIKLRVLCIKKCRHQTHMDHTLEYPAKQITQLQLRGFYILSSKFLNFWLQLLLNKLNVSRTMQRWTKECLRHLLAISLQPGELICYEVAKS